MGESHWLLYDLVVIAIGVLCIWNGVSGGAYKAVGGFVVTILSLAAAFFLSAPVSEAAYDMFFRDSCRSFVEEKLEDADITDNVRGFLEQNGVYLPYDDEQIAQLIEDVQSNGSIAEQAAEAAGIDTELLESELGSAIEYAVEAHKEIIPDWAADTINDSSTSFDVDAAADTAVALLRDDAGAAAAGIEDTYVKPAVLPVLKVIAFIALSALLAMLLRAFLRAVPGSRTSLTGAALGGTMGALKAVIYLFLIVQLTSCISSMENGSYPFFNKGTINRTYIFSIFYDMFADIL